MKDHKEDSLDHQAHEHKNNGSQLGGFIAGVLAGGLAGAGAMLLLAPQSGKRTRTQIQRRSLELKDQATDAVDDAVAQTRDTSRRIRAGTRAKMKRFQHRANVLLEEQKTRVSAAVESGKHAILGSA